MVDHEKQIEDQNIKHLKSIKEEQTLNYKREEQLKNELDFVKTSFHSYKVKFLFFSIFFYKSIFSL